MLLIAEHVQKLSHRNFSAAFTVATKQFQASGKIQNLRGCLQGSFNSTRSKEETKNWLFQQVVQNLMVFLISV
ncbi:hypothetical protein JAAARDRAFT_587240 [Jaapia argillacea MUCL 33604]|uniref:Uncharacterized protein n=1 Tax=Jaapia argillacea MUCL 33604 TaxID=933084 RepID=A0A067PHA9_9AGAM|nr:hypothetical protein JAAARDRAFT_587240 [Jaapia argillacea MUCL 33604]